VAIIAAILIGNYLLDIDKDFPDKEIAVMIVTVLVAMYFQYILPKYSVHHDDTEEDVTLHDTTHFRRIYFEDIIRNSSYETICIVVDNLDRVEADDALGIMRTIKTFIVDADKKGTCSAAKDACSSM
jgi:hypothetical protein